MSLSKKWRGNDIFTVSVSQVPSDHLVLTWLLGHLVFFIWDPTKSLPMLSHDLKQLDAMLELVKKSLSAEVWTKLV